MSGLGKWLFKTTWGQIVLFFAFGGLALGLRAVIGPELIGKIAPYVFGVIAFFIWARLDQRAENAEFEIELLRERITELERRVGA